MAPCCYRLTEYGSAASTGFPVFVDGPVDSVWDPTKDQCVQNERFTDYTGVDSLSSCLGAIIAYVVVHMIEVNVLNCSRPLFNLPGLVGYYKQISIDDDDVDALKVHVNDDTSVNNDDDTNVEVREAD
jgi:hypothetical protein